VNGDYFKDYTAVLIATIAGAIMVVGGFVAALVISPRARAKLKSLPYECGIVPEGQHWTQMHFRYYFFAILFLIFDVEAVFLFPWAIVFLSPALSSAVFYAMMIFIGVLLFGLFYCWKKGLLQWR
jgi:NADH-quinone oxidoreductase subunit A